MVLIGALSLFGNNHIIPSHLPLVLERVEVVVRRVKTEQSLHLITLHTSLPWHFYNPSNTSQASPWTTTTTTARSNCQLAPAFTSHLVSHIISLSDLSSAKRNVLIMNTKRMIIDQFDRKMFVL